MQTDVNTRYTDRQAQLAMARDLDQILAMLWSSSQQVALQR
jgi:hypothetical protein